MTWKAFSAMLSVGLLLLVGMAAVNLATFGSIIR